MKISYIPYDGNELNDICFKNCTENNWKILLKKKLEQEGHEIHTYDIIPIEEADMILSFDNIYFQNFRFFKKIYKLNKLGCTTHIDYEPPSANCRIHNVKGLKKLSHLFKSLITYNDDAVNNKNIIKGCIGDYYDSEFNYKNDFSKRKLVAMIANNRSGLMLFGSYPGELYSKRAEAVNFFQEKCPNDFDLYGNYWEEKLKKCYRYPVDRKDKLSIISKYRFLISYDSLSNQNGYISEKIFDCFKAKTVPIYWGAENVTEYIPKNCFIDKRDFDSYEDLYNFILNITEKQYNKYIKNIEKYLKSDKYLNLFSSEASANIIYKELMKPKRHINKLIASYIINKFDLQRKKDIRYNYSINYYDTSFPNYVNLYEYEEIKKSKTLDYFFKFKINICKNYKIDYLFYRINNEYKKINIKTEELSNIFNAYKLYFSIKLSDIILNEKIELFILNKDKNQYEPLDINVEADCTGFKKSYNLIFKKNKIIILKSTKIRRKLRNYKVIRIIYRIIKLPYIFLKQFIETYRQVKKDG